MLKVFRFCLFIFLISCQTSDDHIEGIWIGGATTHDINYHLPFTNLYSFNSTNQCIIKSINGSLDSFEYELHQNKLNLNDKENDKLLSYKQFEIENKHIVFKEKHVSFHLAKCPISKLDFKKVEALMQKNNWINTKTNETCIFSPNGRFFQSAENSGFNNYCYKLSEFQGLVFLNKYGNQTACEKHNQFLEQVVEISEHKLRVFRWQNGEFETVNYSAIKKNPNEKIDLSPFQLCNKYLNKNHGAARYYSTGANFPGRLYELNKIFAESYRAPQINESGIIRLRFVINCLGQTGQFELLGMDKNYKEKDFSSEITNQILTISKKITGWKSGSLNGKVVDSYFFLSFKIVNGEITEIFP